MEEKNIAIENIIMPINLISTQIDTIVKHELHQNFNITFADFNLLRAILILGTCSQVEIADHNLVTEAAISKRISKLIKNNLITKTTDQNDTRKHLLSLTPKGKKKMNSIFKVIKKRMEAIFKNIQPQERTQLLLLLKATLKEVVHNSPNKDTLTNSSNNFIKNILDK